MWPSAARDSARRALWSASGPREAAMPERRPEGHAHGDHRDLWQQGHGWCALEPVLLSASTFHLIRRACAHAVVPCAQACGVHPRAAAAVPLRHDSAARVHLWLRGAAVPPQAPSRMVPAPAAPRRHVARSSCVPALFQQRTAALPQLPQGARKGAAPAACRRREKDEDESKRCSSFCQDRIVSEAQHLSASPPCTYVHAATFHSRPVPRISELVRVPAPLAGCTSVAATRHRFKPPAGVNRSESRAIASQAAAAVGRTLGCAKVAVSAPFVPIAVTRRNTAHRTRSRATIYRVRVAARRGTSCRLFPRYLALAQVATRTHWSRKHSERPSRQSAPSP